MSIRIRLSKRQVSQALEKFVREKGYELIGGIHIEKKETMDDSWYEAWAWVDKDVPFEVEKDEKVT